LSPIQGISLNELATNFDQEDLDENSKDHNYDEHFVVEKAMENIQFSFSNLSSVNQVENLEEYEHLENNCVVKHFVSMSKHFILRWHMLVTSLGKPSIGAISILDSSVSA
jgi:hypothetical protein